MQVVTSTVLFVTIKNTDILHELNLTIVHKELKNENYKIILDTWFSDDFYARISIRQ